MTIDEVVDAVIAQLDETQVDDIRRHPSPTRMHFGLGLWIRNNYVHGGRMGTVSSPDSLSWTITEKVARKLLPEYAPYPLAFALLDDGYGALQSAHRFCLDCRATTMVDAIGRHYPVLEAAERDFRRQRISFDRSMGVPKESSRELDETYGLYRSAQASFMWAVVDDVFNADVIREVEGSHDACMRKRAEDVSALRNYAFESESGHQSFFVPAEVAYLANPALRGSERWNEGRKALLWLLGEIPLRSSEVPLPSWLFDDDGIALTALRMNGNLLAFMPDRSGDKAFVCTALKTSWPAYALVDESLLHDRDVIRAAFECPSCGTVLADERFRQYLMTPIWSLQRCGLWERTLAGRPRASRTITTWCVWLSTTLATWTAYTKASANDCVMTSVLLRESRGAMTHAGFSRTSSRRTMASRRRPAT